MGLRDNKAMGYYQCMKLTQVAKWNANLTNPYRTRYAEHAGRYFKVSASSLTSPWDVEEIAKDGTYLNFIAIAMKLSEAREIIQNTK